MQGPWEKYGGAPAQTAPQAPGVIMGRPKAPDPYKVQQDAESDARADTNTGLSVESGTRSQKGQVQDFRKEYSASMPVKTYGVAITSAANAVKRGEDASGDIALIYDYAKAMDPESVVRESEVDMAQGGQSMIETAAARYKKEFGVAGGGVLDPKVRERLRREIISAAKSRRQAYEQQRENFTGIAQRNEFNPEDIIGPHLGAPYREELSQFGASGRRFTPEEMAARSARQAGEDYRPEPDEIAFNIDLPGSQTSDITAQRLQPQQEAALAAYLKARSGDASFSPAEYQAFAKSLGIEGELQLEPELVDAVRKGEAFPTNIDYSRADEQRRAEAEALMRERGRDERATTGESGFDKGLTLNLSDEISGLIGGVGSAVRGEGFDSGYDRERDVVRAEQRLSRETKGIAPEIIGGLVSPIGMATRAKTVGQFVGQGAALGGLAGFGEGEGAGSSAANALLGAGGGAAIGGALSQAPRAMNALMQTAPGQKVTNAIAARRPNVDADVIAAGERRNIPIRLPDAVESKRPAMAALEKTRTGAPKVASARAEDINAAQRELQAVVPDGATPRDNYELGTALQGALTRTNDKAKTATTALYNRVEKMAPGARSDGAQTVAFVDNEIAKLSGAGKRGNSSMIKALQDMRDDIAETGVSVESLQSLRRSIRQRVQDNNLDPKAGDRMLSLVDEAATKELETALGAANPRAVGAFRSANQSHAERLAFRREVAREFEGTRNSPVDAETAARRLMSKIASKGDEAGFKRTWDTLDDAERNDIAATIVENLAGGGNEFSFAKLAQNLEPDKANYRTLRLVFGKDGAEALKDLQLIARRKTQTQRGLNNSNTGSIVEEKGNALMDTILTVFGYTQGGILGAVAGGAARGIGEKGANAWRARLLLKPDFTKWLRQTPNSTSPAVIDRHFSRLNRIASREQAFLMDARTLQEYMRTMGSEGVGKAAAVSDNGEDNGRK